MIGQQPVTSQEVNDDGSNHMNIDRTIGVNKTEELTFEEPVVLYVHGDDLDIQTDLEDELHTESANDIREEFNATKRIARKPLKCSQCTKKFATKTKLDYHLRTHKKLFECSVCQKKFAIKKTFDRHLRTHKDPFKCSHCEKKFPSKTKLDCHVKKHRKPFECSHCKKKFKGEKTFNRHLRIHSEKFECSHCKKEFASLARLRRHLVTHEKLGLDNGLHDGKREDRIRDMKIHMNMWTAMELIHISIICGMCCPGARGLSY
ncbi:Protein suppressor of hairy wing [Exaiptasia diaphana]|nr:Protein suppressor of hairy wing [Exaiptasia diaphana]